MPIPSPPHHAPISRFSKLNTTKRRERRYHLGPHVRRHHSPKPQVKSLKFRNTKTNSPPDIQPPKPFPPSPNILSQQSQPHIHPIHNYSPPDIRTPEPVPPKPNILIQPPSFQQPRHPSQRRPRRKHPPHPMNQVHSLIPRHNHNVVRRILKKNHPFSLSMFEDEHYLKGARRAMDSSLPFPFPFLPYTH
jgi:hypothetical protein